MSRMQSFASTGSMSARNANLLWCRGMMNPQHAFTAYCGCFNSGSWLLLRFEKRFQKALSMKSNWAFDLVFLASCTCFYSSTSSIQAMAETARLFLANRRVAFLMGPVKAFQEMRRLLERLRCRGTAQDCLGPPNTVTVTELDTTLLKIGFPTGAGGIGAGMPASTCTFAALQNCLFVVAAGIEARSSSPPAFPLVDWTIVAGCLLVVLGGCFCLAV